MSASRPSRAPEHAIPARFMAPSANAWMISVSDTDWRGDDMFGVAWYWIDANGHQTQMATSFSGDLDAFDLEGSVLTNIVGCASPDLAILAMQERTSGGWLDIVAPQLLASDALDAMTKLRLAARWAEAKA